MTLLIISRNYRPHIGGIETYIEKLATEMAKSNHRVIVVAPSLPAGNLFDAQQAFITKRFPGKIFWTPLFTLWILFQIMRFRPDAILHGEWKSGIHTWIIHLIYSIRYFTIAHGRELLEVRPAHHQLITKYLWFIKRRILRSSAGIFPNSRYTASLLSKSAVCKRRVRIIHPGVDPDEFYPDTPPKDLITTHGLENSKTILSVSRLVAHKGHEIIIRALPRLLERMGNVKYLIVGLGPYRRKLECVVRQLQLDQVVIFAGEVEQERLRDYYNVCDVFVMVSQKMIEDNNVEGFGISFLEANACGKPVIGGNSGGISDAILDGETGYLVDPDGPDEVTQKLVAVLSHGCLAKTMGNNGRLRIERKLNWKMTTDMFVKTIESLL